MSKINNTCIINYPISNIIRFCIVNVTTTLANVLFDCPIKLINHEG